MNHEHRRHGWGAAIVTAALVVIADQASKAVVRSALEPGERHEIILGVDLVEVSNRGIAFGFLGDGGAPVLVVTALALGAMLVWFIVQPSRAGLWLAVGLLAGGAIGNLIDRLRLDAVTDFIDPPLWPAFNVADIAITLGAFALVLSVIRGQGTSKPGPA